MKDLAEFDPNLIIKSEIKIEEENVPLPAVPDNPSDSVNVPQKPKKIKKEKNSNDSGLILILEPQERAHYFDNNERKPNSDEKTESNKISKSIEIFCSTCQTKFKGRTDFELHYKKVHQEEPIFSCISCSYNVSKFQLFRAHFNRHNRSDRYKCDFCPKQYSQKSDLKHHKINKHGIKMCRKCNEQFENVDTFREHNKIHHHTGGTVSGGQTCNQCGKVLMTLGGLYTHKKMHEEKPKFRCEVCDKSFFQKINLVNHHKTHGTTRPHQCTKCDKSFFEKSHLQRHLNFHTLVRSFVCEVCSKTYKTERCLKVHSAVHSSFRPFKCNICEKGFLSSSKLKQHYNIHTGDRPYKCKHCERDFTNYPNLLKHTIRRHKVDHRTGEKLVNIPDYVTNKKKPKELKKVANKDKEMDNEKAIDVLQMVKIEEQSPIPSPTTTDLKNMKTAQSDLDIEISSAINMDVRTCPTTSGDNNLVLGSNAATNNMELDKEFHINDNSNDFDMYMGNPEMEEIFNSAQQSAEKIDFTNMFVGCSNGEFSTFMPTTIDIAATTITDNISQFHFINPNLIHLVKNNSRQMENSIDAFN